MTFTQSTHEAPAEGPTSVYRYYDANDLLLYVGITSRGIRRNIEHNGSKEWWPYVVRQEVEHHPTRTIARTVERELIRKYRPPFNTQHNPGSAEVRAAYVMYNLGLSVAPRDEAALLQALPLTPVERDGSRLTLATIPGHAEIARRIKPIVLNQIPCRDGNGNHLGHVVQVDNYGTRATVTVRLKADVGAAVTHATASLKRLHVEHDRLRFSRIVVNGSELATLVEVMKRGGFA